MLAMAFSGRALASLTPTGWAGASVGRDEANCLRDPDSRARRAYDLRMAVRVTPVPLLLAVVACGKIAGCEPRPSAPEMARNPPAAEPDSSGLTRARMTMVAEQIEARGVRDARVLAAMRRVPRHEFVGDAYQQLAYDDTPLPIEDDQTISQPYIVALMTELADVQAGEKVLEVGTGSGYQAAVLSALGAEVYSIEIMPRLAQSARERLERLGYAAHVRQGDGYAGWPEHAPFDAIIITAAPPSVPQPLAAQLAVGGRLVVPVGGGMQDLWVWSRTEHGWDKQNVLPVRFVPMTGRAQQGP
jgi:protein-L-isoaspartate(D-aspartate) O-methyltransferase